MELILLFRRLVFAQVLLGIVAFCMAEQNPAMMLIAGALAALSWYVVEGPTGRPLPNWAIHVGALLAVIWFIFELVHWRSQGRGFDSEINAGMIIAMGHLIIWLQILQLYGKKNNREYALILLLGLMQMIAASVLSVSMIYGLLLAAYCVMALLTALLFQFKNLSDRVYESMRKAAPPAKTVKRMEIVVGRGHRMHLRLTSLFIGLVCALIAAGVFILLPRTEDPLMRGLLSAAMQSQVGFSENVRLGGGSIAEGGEEVVLKMELLRDGRPVGEEKLGLLLRGTALDEYDPQTHAWHRSNRVDRQDLSYRTTTELQSLMTAPMPGPELQASITLKQPPRGVLFTLLPITALSTANAAHVEFNSFDYRLRVSDRQRRSSFEYTLTSPESLPPYNYTLDYLARENEPPWRSERFEHMARGWDIPGHERIYNLALRLMRNNDLTRDPYLAEDENDLAIMATFVDYFNEPANRFRYSLDNRAGTQSDPLLAFLFQYREGHCELYASALAAMARSVGMQARVVTGYRVSEYNNVGGYFIVRDKNAHAWTEVNILGRGWMPFDATPSDELEVFHHRERGWFSGLRDIYEHIEFAWIRSVVTFDEESRSELFAGIKEQWNNLAATDSPLGGVVQFFKQLPDRWRVESINYTFISLLLIFIGIGLFSLARTLIIRKRRLAALQLTAVPMRQRRGLSRRLRFYLVMLDMLERHGYHRPVWQSPADFAHQLVHTKGRHLDPVAQLTEVFYEIRFGYRNLDDDRQMRIRTQMRQLEDALAK